MRPSPVSQANQCFWPVSLWTPVIITLGIGLLMFLLFLFICLFLSMPCAAYGILVPWPRIKPLPLAVEAQSANHWTVGKFLDISFKIEQYSYEKAAMSGGLLTFRWSCRVQEAYFYEFFLINQLLFLKIQIFSSMLNEVNLNGSENIDMC